MIERHRPAELPPHVTDEEKTELVRGRRLLEVMIDLVKTARPVAQDVPSGEDTHHE